MPVVKIEAIEYTCDGCGKIQLVHDEMEIFGYTGNVFWQHEAGGHSADWYACTQKCIQKAVITALKYQD